jgi:hypothetical protein
VANRSGIRSNGGALEELSGGCAGQWGQGGTPGSAASTKPGKRDPS